MNAITKENGVSPACVVTLIRAFIVAGVLLFAKNGLAQPNFSDGNSDPDYPPLNSWSFTDSTLWKSDLGYAPISFTNLAFSNLGDFHSLVVDTNVPAWLQYNVYESDGNINLTVDSGTVMFWFAPTWFSASDTNGGFGPGECGRLFEAGSYTDDSSYGWWSIFVDTGGTNLYFTAQTNDLSSTITTYLSAPIDWTTNYFHFVALTYSPTSSVLYLDGVFVTSGPGVTVYPGPDVLTNGFCIGSDCTGVYQAHGLFNTVQTFDYPLASNDVAQIYQWEYPAYKLSPLNTAMFNIVAAPNSTTTYTPFADVITGAGFLQWAGSTTTNYSANGTVWITNTSSLMSGGTNFVVFTIQGGLPNSLYDVFATAALTSPRTNGVWYWMGQGSPGNIYTLPIVSQNVFLILGTPQDSDSDGLTDAYELLVSHTSPTNYTTDGSGMADGWEVLYFGHIGISTNADPDGDGLNNYQEFQMYSQGYNPTKWNSSTNSVVGDGYQNYSGDGLANLLQTSFGGNMMTNNLTWKANVSGDGLSDEYKTMVGLSPGSATPAPGLPAYSKNPIQ